ncbi:hypothetical protein MHU86_24117 [Fragilaria crotonensis]|nr:hypothetical protein MHU86_24117 [Fragilaria crotonensis]
MARTRQTYNATARAFRCDNLPTSVQVQLDQPFGKDSLQQSFYSAKSLCHILLPLLKSGFLSCRATKALEKHRIGYDNFSNFEKVCPTGFSKPARLPTRLGGDGNNKRRLESDDISMCPPF